MALQLVPSIRSHYLDRKSVASARIGCRLAADASNADEISCAQFESVAGYPFQARGILARRRDRKSWAIAHSLLIIDTDSEVGAKPVSVSSA